MRTHTYSEPSRSIAHTQSGPAQTRSNLELISVAMSVCLCVCLSVCLFVVVANNGAHISRSLERQSDRAHNFPQLKVGATLLRGRQAEPLAPG